MNKLKSQRKSIYFAYHHVENPWGGANNFIRALRKTISKSVIFEILETPSSDCDIVFMNQLSAGPDSGGKSYSIDEIKNMLGSKTRLIVRAINLRRNSVGYNIHNYFNEFKRDSKALTLLHMADHVIFQGDSRK